MRSPTTFLAVLVTNREGQARLDFIQNVSFKFVELLSLPFTRSPDDVVRAHCQYRYARVKAQLAVARERLAEVVSLCKAKNPSLLLALTAQGRAAGAGGAAGVSSSAGAGKAPPPTPGTAHGMTATSGW